MSLLRSFSGDDRHMGRRLLFELIIIFVGVYGAFWVERYPQKLEDRERSLSILGALEAELSNITDYGPYVRDAMGASLQAFDSARARGEMPSPAYYREPDAETPTVAVWEATVASGGVNLLDPQLFFSLAAFYNRVTSFSQRYLRYNAFTEAELLPLLSEGPEGFYHPRTGELASRFGVHLDQLRLLQADASDIIQRAEVMVTEVRAEMERLR